MNNLSTGILNRPPTSGTQDSWHFSGWTLLQLIIMSVRQQKNKIKWRLLVLLIVLNICCNEGNLIWVNTWLIVCAVKSPRRLIVCAIEDELMRPHKFRTWIPSVVTTPNLITQIASFSVKHAGDKIRVASSRTSGMHYKLVIMIHKEQSCAKQKPWSFNNVFNFWQN